MNFFNPYKQFVGSFIPNCLLQYNGLSDGAKLLWSRLAQYAGADGYCYPKQDTLAKDLGKDKRTIQRLLKELEREGFIYVEQPTGKERLMHRNNRYYFIKHAIFDYSADFTTNKAPSEAVNMSSPTVVNMSPPMVVNMSPPTKENHIKENHIKENHNYVATSDEVRLSELLYDLILKNNPKAKKPNIQNWAKYIDLMIRVDGRTPDEIEGAIRWAQSDSFWCANILSTKKLREKYDTLFLQAKRKKNGKTERAISDAELKEFAESIANDPRLS